MEVRGQVRGPVREQEQAVEASVGRVVVEGGTQTVVGAEGAQFVEVVWQRLAGERCPVVFGRRVLPSTVLRCPKRRGPQEDFPLEPISLSRTSNG